MARGARGQSKALAFDLADDSRQSARFDLALLRRLGQWIRPQMRWIWMGLGLLLLTAACRLSLPWLVKIAIDDHVTPRSMEGFGGLLAIFVGVALIEILGKGGQTWVVDQAGQNALLELRMAVFRHLQRLSTAFYDKTPIGRLVGRVTTDVEALQEMFSAGVVTILGDLIFLVATLWILFAMSWKLTLVTLLVVPVLLVLTTFIRVRVRKVYARMTAARSALNGFLHEHVVGMPVLQAFTQEGEAREGFGEINGALRDEQLRGVYWESSLSALTEMLGSMTVALILWYGGGLVGVERNGLTLGALFAFVDYMQKFFVPLTELSLQYTVLQNAMTAAERIFLLLDTDERIPEPERPVELPETRGSVEFRDVTFGYDPAEPILRKVSFAVRPGERVAIVGATGAGKTTILKLLTRLYDVQQGAVLLDGVDVREYALQNLRTRVGIVPQDVFLFSGTVLENVRLGHPEISDADAMAAADALHLDEVVRRFPQGYQEPVRERGANLSSGERQLVAFARVLAVAPRVLALDEATSNVDSHTEHLLQEAVHVLMEGRTALIIAHRLSTIRDVDRILVFHKGELVEDGPHDELLEQRGVYWRLYQLQYQETSANGEAS